MRSVAKASEEYQQILAYVEQMPHGAIVRYDDIEALLGIPIGPAERKKLHRALMRAGREFSAIPNIGYQLADPRTAMPILVHRLVRIDHSVKRADRAQRIVQDEFYEQLTPEEQKQARFIGAVFGAFQVAAENGKKLYHKPRPQISGSAMIIDIVV